MTSSSEKNTFGLDCSIMGPILRANKSILQRRIAHISENRLNVFKAFLSKDLAKSAEHLHHMTNGKLRYSFFCNSQSEANEGALKLATKYFKGKKKKIVAFSDSFHGTTLGAMSVSGLYQKFQTRLPLATGIQFTDFYADKSFEKIIHEQKNEIAAVIVETVPYHSFQPRDVGLMQKYASICQSANVLFIVDESIFSFCRYGPIFYYSKMNLSPDIVTLGPTMANNLINAGAYICNKKIFQKAYGKLFDSIMHTSTYNGFGIDTAIILATLNEFKNFERLKSSYFRYNNHQIDSWIKKYPSSLKSVRGREGSWALEFRNKKICSFVKKCLLSEHNIKTDRHIFQEHTLHLFLPLDLSPQESFFALSEIERAIAKPDMPSSYPSYNDIQRQESGIS